MYRHSLSSLYALTSLLLCLGSGSASAAAEPYAKAQRYSVKTSASSIQAGAAKIDVAADAQLVTQIIQDFGSYPKLSDKFEKARVIGRNGDETDVYMQVPILKGAAKIWAVMRFSPVRDVNGEQILAGHMLKGNVKRLDAKWTVRAAGAKQSHVALELLIVPKLPVPGSLVTSETAYAADKAVTGVRDRAEHR
jgi:ribosome-associated toxin RatA of RatAB toxin-antitoxin module